MVTKGKNSTFRFFQSLIHQIIDGEIQILASSLAFGTLISIVPLLAVSLSISYAFGGLDSFLKTVEPFLLHDLLPASVADIGQAIRHSVARVHSGALGVMGLLSMLVISTKIFFDIEYAVQTIWRLQNPRSLTLRVFIYWLVLFSVPILIAALIGFLGSHDFKSVISLPKDSVRFLVILAVIFAINKLMPTTKVRGWVAFLCSIGATIAMSVLQTSYATLNKKIFSYSAVYGSLASVPLFLLWILLVWWIILMSVAVCASLHHFGESRPMRA